MKEMNKINVEALENVNGRAAGLTHGGVFHADEVFATAILWMAGLIEAVVRTFAVPADLPEGVIVYDIGGIYDPDARRFDHHIEDFDMGRAGDPDKIKFSSAGMIWAKYGLELCGGNEAVWAAVDQSLIRGIDAVDNGQATPGIGNAMSVSSAVSAFNPNWDDPQDFDGAFIKAVEFARGLLERELQTAVSRELAASIMAKAIEEAGDSPILVLPRFVPWQTYVADTRFMYVVFPSIRGGYMVQCVPTYENGIEVRFTQRKSLPKEWWGLRGTALSDVCGVAGAIFAHPNGFCGSAQTLEGAVEMATLAVNA